MLEQPSNFIPKGRVKEVKGDCSIPESAGNRFILVPVPDNNKPNGGSVYKRWPIAEANYKHWFVNSYGKMNEWLGKINTIQVQSDTVVVNMLCISNEEYDYEALKKCIDAVGKEAANNSGNVHMSKFGDWEKVSPLIDELLLKRGLNVTVYV